MDTESENDEMAFEECEEISQNWGDKVSREVYTEDSGDAMRIENIAVTQ